MRFTISRTVFLLSPSRWLISRYDCPSATSFRTLAAQRSALIRCPGRRPNTTPRLRGAIPGEIRDRSYENQSHRASGLNLLFAAIILWNTVYLQRAVDHLHSQGYEPTPSDLAHLSPLGWEHINLTGDYHWETAPSFGPDQFIPLRTHAYDFAAAA